MIENPTIFLGIMRITPRKNEKNMFFATKQSPKRQKTCVKKHQLVIKKLDINAGKILDKNNEIT